MNKYECLYIIDNELDDESKNAIVTKFSTLVGDNGGKVTALDIWGTRKFAYKINFKAQYRTEGYYVLMGFESDGSFVAELERQMRNNEDIVRELVTAIEE